MYRKVPFGGPLLLKTTVKQMFFLSGPEYVIKQVIFSSCLVSDTNVIKRVRNPWQLVFDVENYSKTCASWAWRDDYQTCDILIVFGERNNAIKNTSKPL